jgi:hypothetical protein
MHVFTTLFGVGLEIGPRWEQLGLQALAQRHNRVQGEGRVFTARISK